MVGGGAERRDFISSQFVGLGSKLNHPLLVIPTANPKPWVLLVQLHLVYTFSGLPKAHSHCVLDETSHSSFSKLKLEI